MLSSDVQVDWGPTVGQHLSRWQRPELKSEDLDRAERWVLTTAMKKSTMPGSWRLKVVNGSLYVKVLKASPHWLERANVLRLVYGVHASKPLPDLDAVYVHSDMDPAPALRLPAACMLEKATARENATAQSMCGRQVPLLTNAYLAVGKSAQASFPLPDFSWVGWNSQPPWCVLSSRLQTAAAHQPFKTRADRLYFAGSLSNGPFRHELASLARTADAADALAVYDVTSRFSLGKKGKGPSRQRPNEEACGYKYLLSIPGFGYSNRLRQLLSCGSVVFHIGGFFNEFFMPQLEPGVHYVAVNTVAQLLHALKRIRADPARAERIGAAAGEAARRLLSFDSARSYTRQLLTELASRRHGEPVALGPAVDRPGTVSSYVKLTSEASIMQVVRQCNCGATWTTGAAGTSPSTHTSVGSDGQIYWRYREGGRERRNDSTICHRQLEGQCCQGYNCATSNLDC